MTPQAQYLAAVAAENPCCGKRHPGVAGEPLKLACQLCPKSPTYWRLSLLPDEAAALEERFPGA
jgi:hypothetical protein